MSTSLPPLGALRAFEAVARLGSLVRAAEELHVTHGAVSRQLKLLEQALGRPLLRRAGRGVALTEDGRRLQAAASTALDGLRRSWRQLRQDSGAGLVLGCSSSVLARWMIPRLERLHRDLPGLRLHLSPQPGDLPPELSGLDAALLLASPPWPEGWRVWDLARERIGPVASTAWAGLPALAGRPAAAVLGLPLLQTTSRPQAWPDWAAANGLDPAGLGHGEAFPQLYYLLEAAASGLGLAIAPEPLVAADLAAGRLCAPWGFTATGGSWVLCAPAGHDDPRLARLADWLRAELAGPAMPAAGSASGDG